MNTQLVPQLQRQYHESSREIRGSYWALKGHLTSSQGDHWDRPLRSDGSRNGQAGEAGPVLLSGGQESQTKGQGTVRLPPQWATTEAARRGAKGLNKGPLSR